uniref:Uncharacterized protein n=1 Tax=Arundo donax TaxID=35708 RepID=A0A0A8Z800_ARUDO
MLSVTFASHVIVSFSVAVMNFHSLMVVTSP